MGCALARATVGSSGDTRRINTGVGVPYVRSEHRGPETSFDSFW